MVSQWHPTWGKSNRVNHQLWQLLEYLESELSELFIRTFVQAKDRWSGWWCQVSEIFVPEPHLTTYVSLCGMRLTTGSPPAFSLATGGPFVFTLQLQHR